MAPVPGGCPSYSGGGASCRRLPYCVPAFCNGVTRGAFSPALVMRLSSLSKAGLSRLVGACAGLRVVVVGRAVPRRARGGRLSQNSAGAFSTACLPAVGSLQAAT